MLWSEARGVIAVIAAIVAVTLAFLVLLDRSGDTVDLTSVGTTTTTSTTTTTIDPRDDTRPVTQLCAAAVEFVQGAESQAFVWPGKVPQLAETFYLRAYDLAVGDIRPEYAAALAYYEDYNDVAEPAGYDPVTALKGPDADRFRQLASREPPGVEETRVNISFLCGGLEVPRPPIIPPDEFEEIEETVAEELEDEEEA